MGNWIYYCIGAGLVGLAYIQYKNRGSPLSVWEKVRLVFGLVHFRMTWGKHDCSQKPETRVDPAVRDRVRSNPKFVSADEAASMIPDGSVVNTSGFPASERCAIFFWAVRERHLKTQHPKDLTWISVGAQGARGKAPGSVEELDPPGLLTKYISGHLETAKSLLRAANAGRLELYNLPQGTLAQLVAAQSKGVYSLAQTVGIGTYFDPRVGNMGKITKNCKDDLVTLSTDGNQLVYSIPKITVSIVNARCCDADGNVYLHENTTLTETRESIKAAKLHGGLVMVSVQYVFDKAPNSPLSTAGSSSSDWIIPAKDVDAIVLHDAGGVRDNLNIRDKFILEARSHVTTAQTNKIWNSMRFVNTFLKLTPFRTEADIALGRLAATCFLSTFENCPGKKIASIGVGLPEEVGHNLLMQGLCPDYITLCTETGSLGGLPGMGIFFGNSIAPRELMTSAGMFDYWQTNLHTACLGAAEVDKEGNVNVSRRGDTIFDVIGSGGFPNMVDCAKNVVFVCQWSNKAKIQISSTKEGPKMKFQCKGGKPKFIDKVGEITFSGKAALRKGINVYYVTHVGVFRLTDSGLELVQIMPGLDATRDVLEFAKDAKIHVAAGGAKVIESSVLNGKNFVLKKPN